MKYILFLFLMVCSVSAQTTHYAATCSRADVASKIAEVVVVDGDTVVVPVGTTSDWTTNLNITKAITLIGSGFSNNSAEGQPELYTWGTTFLDGMSSVSSMLTFTLPAGKTGRVSQINFQGNNISRSGAEPGCIQLTSFGQYRVDHCKFTLAMTRNVSLVGNAIGVADHNWHHNKDGWHAYHFKNGDTYSGSVNGNGAWNEASTVGTANNWFVENCYFSSTSSHYVGLFDSWNGGKGVFRFNRAGNNYQLHYSNHGTESSANFRSGRMLEIYKNTFTTLSNHSRIFEMRGGTGVHWGNVISMPGTTSMALSSYRADGSNDPPHFHADGTLLWDAADLTDGAGTPGGAGDGVFETGTSVVSNCLNRAATVGATVTQAGTTITCSAPLFTSGMVGKVVAWASSVPEGTTTPATITSFTDSTHVVCSGTNRTRSTPASFIVGDAKVITDPTKTWTTSPTGQWVGYTLRTVKNYTGTSGTATSVTVAGAGWATNQWINSVITRTSNGQKGSVLSNTSDTINFRTDFYQPSFASGVLDFSLNRSGKIVSNTGQAITIASQHDSYLVFTDPTDFEIRRITFVMDQPGAGPSNIPSPTSKPPHQYLAQGHAEPIYNWNNSEDGAILNVGGQNYNIQANRDYFNGVSLAVQTTPTSPFDGSAGVGMGTLANRPSSGLTTGVGYWATDQGEWDSTNGAVADGLLYVATSPTTWALKYTPYSYPHPLVSGAVDTTPPIVTNIVVNGATATWSFTESVTGVSAAHYAMSGGLSLSSASGSGTTYTMTISPPATYGATYTAGYTAGTTMDTVGNALPDFSGATVINSTPNPGTPATRTPGRRPAAGRF